MKTILCILSLLFADVICALSFGLPSWDTPAQQSCAYSLQSCILLSSSHSSDESAPDMKVDCQSDVEKCGRGISHITADLSDGDIIAYQDGTWYVDGLTEVGDGSPPVVRYMQVEVESKFSRKEVWGLL